uniref:Copper transport protein n=1 Tax=Timema shepardi TaxID=629360 RepID=A0A7R9AR65_TIMSH|nr:unnamed protein product [Timema shepardi]
MYLDPTSHMNNSEMDHSTMNHGAMDHGAMDHGAMGHGTMDHGTMDHGTMDHGTMDHSTHASSNKDMDMCGMSHGMMMGIVMVRTYIKKRNKPEISNKIIQEAVRAVCEGKLSLRAAASKYDMTHTALFYQVKRFKKGDEVKSPVKNKIEEETLARASRKEKSCSSRPKVSLKQKELFMKKRLVYSSSDSDGEFSVQDSSDEETLHDLITVERNDTEEIVVDDFVLTEFATKKTKVLYVGHVEEVNGHTYKIRFMRRFRQTWKFTYPETEDISEMERSDIVMKLPQPESSGGTARIMTMKNFHVDFSSMKEKIMVVVVGEFLFWKTYNALQYTSVSVPSEKGVVSEDNRIVQPTMCSRMHYFQTFLHIIQIILSYLLMLIFMTYNLWLCLAVVLGAATGYFLFGWKKSVIVDVTEHCH